MLKDKEIQNLSDDLSCRSCREWLHPFLEGETDPLSSRAIKGHLAICPDCAGEARILEKERIELLEAMLVSPALSPRFPRRITREILRRQAETRRRKMLGVLRRLVVTMASGAALILAAFLGANLLGLIPGERDRGIDVAAATPGTVIHGTVIHDTTGLTSTSPSVSAAPACSTATDITGEASDDSNQIVPVSARLDLNDSINFTSNFFPLDQDLPCQRDLNNDGETDASDAAHLFMLATMDNITDSDALGVITEVQQNCNSPCI